MTTYTDKIMLEIVCENLMDNMDALFKRMRSQQKNSIGLFNLWDLETNEYIRTLEGHTDEIHWVNAFVTGHLISDFKEKSLKVWNPSDGVCLKTIACTNLIRRLKVLSRDLMAIGSLKRIHVWDLNTEKCIQTLVGPFNCFQCLITLPDETLVSSSHDNTIQIWDLDFDE